METLPLLKDTVAKNLFEILGETQVKVNIKMLDYQMVDRQGKLKIEKLGDTTQPQI